MDPVHLERHFMFLSGRTTGLTSVVEENFKQQIGMVRHCLVLCSTVILRLYGILSPPHVPNSPEHRVPGWSGLDLSVGV